MTPTGEPRLPSASRRTRMPAPADAPARAPRTPFALLLIALFGGALVLLLVLNTASAANEVRRHGIAARDASVAAQLQDLQNQVAASAAPANLAAAAAELGMIPAGNPAFLVVGADGRIRIMGSPAAASQPPVAVPTEPKPSHSKSKSKPSPSKSKSGASTSRASTSRASTSSKAKPGSGRSSGRKSPSPKPKPKPSPTPTPTFSLPGGTR